MKTKATSPTKAVKLPKAGIHPRRQPLMTELYRRAQARLRKQRKGQRSKVGDQKSEAGTVRVLHELQVHQVELEMQNEELKEARDKMEALLEKYTDLYDFAPVGVIRETNLAGASLLGIARSALVDRRFGLFVSPADRPVFNAFIEKVFESGAREECDVSLLMKGRPPLDVGMEAIAFESGQTCRVAVTDITERKRVEADRLILNKLESTGILAGGLAHDFNNLLTVILLDLELVQTLTPAGGDLAQLLAEARKAAVTASSLTQQLITFAKGGTPVRKPTRLAGVIQESVRLALSGSNVRCEFSLAEDLWAAEVDAGQLGQVFRNVALNAREAMPQGGVVFVRAGNVVLNYHEQFSLSPGEYVRVSIADQGVGVAKDVLPKIFDPYFSTKQGGKQRGMGLGLTICHAVVQKHEGAITVESEVGVGTTFHIYLPSAREIGGADAAGQAGGVISQAKTRQLSGGEKAAVPAGVSRPGLVLLMEDEEAVKTVVGLTLRGMGHEVELAENGQMAIEVYKKAQSLGRHFDVVLLDLTVRGGMGGQETIQALLKIDPAMKAIAMSGYAHDPVILEPERHGFKGALAKPFEGDKLQEIISRVMGPGSSGKRPVA
jgi:signal transduction histidine kinase/ActR/RegA family two-component response regulator